MKSSALRCGVFTCLIVLAGGIPALAQTIKKDELQYQQQNFKQWWGTELVTKFDDLPTVGAVPKFRVPYSGHDYPDQGGGTIRALAKYDRAFNKGRQIAAQFEADDVRASRFTARRMGLASSGGFGRFRGGGSGADGRMLRMPLFRGRVPGWYGHCNGWTAAAIRHAEPQQSVRRGNVVFTPADIKGLLAEIYMYTDTEFLGGVDTVINPAVFHLTVTNWVGRGSHPVGMEKTPGQVAFNYPIYTYRSVINKRSAKQVEVETRVRYATSTPREMDKSPRQNEVAYFHYTLDLDDEGNITGGRYYGDSTRIDMLWTPLKPIQGGKKGNELGNPHVDVEEVLAIWRESVSKELRDKWFNIDPTDEDRLAEDEAEEKSAVAEKPVDDKKDQ